MIERVALAGFAVVLGLAAAGPAAAEEVRQQLNAPMILNLLARPIEPPDVAFNKSLKRDVGAPAAERADGGQVMPDGSVRYGRANGNNVSVMIRNPCPPGDFEHEAAQLRALPGRRRTY